MERRHVTFPAQGHDDIYKQDDDPNKFMTDLRNNGSKHLRGGAWVSFTCIIYTLLLLWASEVARENQLPSALLWIQPATVLSIYYHYFNGFQHLIETNSNDPSWRIQIPGAPLLAKSDLPSFLDPSDTYSFILMSFKEQLDSLDQETEPKVLINTFDALEHDALTALDKYELIGVGPLIPSDDSLDDDLYQNSDDDHIEWMNSEEESSVVFVESQEAAVGGDCERVVRCV